MRVTSSLARPERVANSFDPLSSERLLVIGPCANRVARTAQPPPLEPRVINQLQTPVGFPPWRLVERVTAMRTGRAGSGVIKRPKTACRLTRERVPAGRMLRD